MVDVIATYYADNPWEQVTQNQRTWYDPLLRDMYRKRAVFGQYTSFKQNLAGVSTQTMVVTQLMDLHPNINPMGNRDIWINASHFDSRNVEITFKRYGGKVAYHEFDDIITYWRANGQAGLASIIQGKLGLQMIDVLDLLSRNAILSSPYKMYGGGASSFNDLLPVSSTQTTDYKLTTELIDFVHLGMQNRDVPYAADPNGDIGTIVGIISPGVFFDLQQQSTPKDWIGRMQYARPITLLRYEVGMFRNVRWVVTPKAYLYNAGQITVQAVVTAPINAGDGALTNTQKVDNVWRVGQNGVTPYVTVDTVTDFAVNDIVTLHVNRTDDNGVTNGVDFTDGKAHHRRIVQIDSVNKRLMFDLPILEDFTVDLDSPNGVYGYITKGQHISACMFIGGPDGVVQGVARPPRFTAAPPIDDTLSTYRFAWNSYMGYNVYNPSVLETVYVAGSFRQIGNGIRA
jgi:N4-gp56 family major capsid protein